MKLHAIVGLGKSPVKVNYVSCYCPRSCQVCKGWNDAVKTTFVAENNVSEEMDVSITERKVMSGMHWEKIGIDDDEKGRDYIYGEKKKRFM